MILKLKQTPGIFLVGFMGCGKSTVGSALADELGWSFFDLDEEIEKAAGASVTEIFDQRGEAEFRTLETEALKKRVHNVRTGRPQVIALGGGAFTFEENFDWRPITASPSGWTRRSKSSSRASPPRPTVRWPATRSVSSSYLRSAALPTRVPTTASRPSTWSPLRWWPAFWRFRFFAPKQRPQTKHPTPK